MGHCTDTTHIQASILFWVGFPSHSIKTNLSSIIVDLYAVKAGRHFQLFIFFDRSSISKCLWAFFKALFFKALYPLFLRLQFSLLPTELSD